MQIIILHGWGHNKLLWKSLASKLGKDASVIDLPGFGSEKLVKNDWGIPEYSTWVQSKIKKSRSLILIGHSFGGRIAAEIASKNPPYLKGLVLSGAPCVYRPSTKTKLKIKLYKNLKKFVPTSYRRYLFTKDLVDAQSKNLEKVFRKVVNYDQSTQLKKIRIPTLCIWGENDEQVPLRVAREIVSLIPNAELKVIETSGHNAYLDKPDLFFGCVKNFLSGIK